MAGLFYLFSIVFGIVAMILIRRKMPIRGDEVNVLAGVLYSGMTLLLWHLLRAVSEWLSAVAAIISLAGCWLPQWSWYKAAHLNSFLFFGIYCLLTGYLIWRSRFFPKIIGAFMVFAGVCWLITTWPALTRAISPYPGIAGLVGEGTLMAYLIVKGLDEQRWTAELIAHRKGSSRAAQRSITS